VITVSLFRDLPEERRVSMEVYADHLAAGLRHRFPGQLRLQEVCLPGAGEPSNGRPGRVMGRIAAGLRRFVEYPRAAARLQADINHIIDHGYADLALRMDKSRTVITCHDLVLLKREVRALNPRGYSRLALNRFRWYSVRGLEMACQVIAISECTRRDLLRHTNCKSDNITTIPYGVSSRFSPERAPEKVKETRRQHGIPEMSVVLHVGHVDFYKNIEGLLRIFAKIRERAGAGVTLVRVGPRLTPPQRALASRLGLKDDLVEIGPLPSARLPEIYRTATVFLFPSLYEGFGMPPLEAMACGVPVVSSDAGALGEVVGEAGLRRSATDEEGMAGDVHALLLDRARRQELVEKGLQRARLFSWELNAERTREVYEQVMRQGRRA